MIHPNKVPNGDTTPITVSGAGVVALPTIPAGTNAAIISNPNAAVVIAFGATATANLGIKCPAGSCPALDSPEQVNGASIYWAAADAGACIQYFK
jgi:hypothetical protein